MATSPDGAKGEASDRNLSQSTACKAAARRSGASMTSAGEQVNAYVAWVNAKLKRKPGCRAVEDLNSDLQDGVALVHLIEVVAHEKLEGIYLCPSTVAEKTANVEAVIAFMTRNHIRMHHMTAQDIVQGNLKAVMRLILAFAAHFNPRSVRQSNSASNTPLKDRKPSIAAIAQNAAVTLAEARRDASRASFRPRRPRQLKKDIPRSSDTSSDSDQPPSRLSAVSLARREAEGASSASTASPRAHRCIDFDSIPKSKSQGNVTSADICAECGHEAEEGVSASFVHHLEEELSLTDDDVNVTKQQLLQLHDLLLNGCAPENDDDSGCPPAQPSDAQSQISILKSQLIQAEEAGRKARSDLSSITQECLHLQGSKNALDKRLKEQEEGFLAMKSDLLRAGFCRQGLETTKEDLQAKLEDKDALIHDLRRELAKKEREVDELKSHFRYYQQEKEGTAHDLRSQVQQLHSRLQRISDAEMSLSSRMSAQDRKMSRLEGCLLQGPDSAPGAPGSSHITPRPSSSHSVTSASSDEMHLVRESLRNLRAHLPKRDDSGQHSAMDALETSIAVLVEQMEHPRESTHRNFDSTGNLHRSPITTIPGYGNQIESTLSNTHPPQTKVLYFTDRTVTPYMCTVAKRIDEVRLRDIKALFDRHNYRFHFKAQDPEFGTVKEEITLDDALVPSYEGKIIAWVEEDVD